jgi:hypothetical protein
MKIAAKGRNEETSLSESLDLDIEPDIESSILLDENVSDAAGPRSDAATTSEQCYLA